MNYSHRILRVLCVAPLLLVALSPSQAVAQGWLERLHSPDVATRRNAVDEIQTLDDPRIPAECLLLLNDDGASIRRQAARAIGSRFRQIPKERVDVYVHALKKCAARGPEDATLMADRAIGLLTRDYSFAAFSKSPDGQWVLYERRRLPVIANIKRQSHALLLPKGSEEEGGRGDTYVDDGNIEDSQISKDPNLLKLMATNEPVTDLFAPVWHPRGVALAFSPVLQMKFFHPICIWRAGDGEVRVWSVESFKPLLHGFPHWSTTTDFVKWDGPLAIIKIYDCDDPGEGQPYDPKGVLVSVDIRTWKSAIVK